MRRVVRLRAAGRDTVREKTAAFFCIRHHDPFRSAACVTDMAVHLPYGVPRGSAGCRNDVVTVLNASGMPPSVNLVTSRNGDVC